MANIPERLAAALSGSYRIEREVGVGGMATVWTSDNNTIVFGRQSQRRRIATVDLTGMLPK